MTEVSKGPKPTSKKQAETWYQIFFRHSVFNEGPLEIERHFDSVGRKLKSDEIENALRWGAENTLGIVADRRALRARTAASIAARSKLVWGEVTRLQNAQRQGGIKETTHTYDGKGKLKSTRITHRDVSRELMGAERALAELDRFGAAVDGLMNPEAAGSDVNQVTMELNGFFEHAYTDPREADVITPELPEEFRGLIPEQVEPPTPGGE